MTDFGRDVSTFPDLDPTFRDLTGPRCVAEAVMRRWLMRPGSLDYDPDAGFDIRSLLSAALDEQELFAAQARLAFEAEKDERVLSAVVSLEMDAAQERVLVHAQLESSEGPFVLTVAADKLSVELLTPI